MKSLFLSLVLLISANAQAEVVYITHDNEAANTEVYVTENYRMADCFVALTTSARDANNWVLVTGNTKAKWVFFVDTPEEASPVGCLEK